MAIPAPILAPWAITEDGYKLVLAIATRGELFSEALSAAKDKYKADHGDKPMVNDHDCEVVNGVAVIPVYGALVRKATIFSDVSGATSYAGIRKQVESALADEKIKAVVFDIDSPGGEAFGCGELSKFIYESRGAKPLIAYASGMMCSAAYWIGSACDSVHADDSAMIGCIGTRTLMVDLSVAEEQAGIKRYDIVSSQSPYKVADPAKEADRSRVQAQMTDMAAVFIADVARNRGVTESVVSAKFGKGDVLIGQYAVTAGLADSLSSLAVEIDSLSPKGARFMAKANPNAKLYDAKCSGCRSDMDDDDEVYCGKCHGEADAKALLSAIGSDSIPAALAAIAGMKQASSEIAAVRESLAKQAAEQAARDFDAEIMAAKKATILAASDEHKRNKQALSYKGTTDAIKSLRGFLGALDPLVNIPGGNRQSTDEPAVSTGGIASLTSEERRIADKMGLSHEAVLKNKARLALKAATPTVIETDEDDDQDAA